MKVFYRNELVVKDITIANNFWTKLSGYMFRNTPHTPAILFETGGSMQTTFMKFNLDIIFLDSKNTIVKVLRNVKPWRFTSFYKGVKKVLELPEGTIPYELSEGEVLSFIE